ncbi:zinc finger matrin-type protein 5-like [Argiope bruennichi]|uniref:zinc finger matrin-type protein 5-like n=1 Tax=Argiope bruennichi TaxID=94029 RepID=UPI00249473C2|nr:zinc finger matrin-type protein 5-like [Argiope bruennichi]
MPCLDESTYVTKSARLAVFARYCVGNVIKEELIETTSLPTTTKDTDIYAATILEEAKSKKPCRKFNTTGHCEFGSNCKYSHLTADDILNLMEQANQEKLGTKGKKPRTDPDIDSWVQTKSLKVAQSSNKGPSDPVKPVLPPIISNIPSLPPSLIPCKPSELLNIKKDAGNHWG